MKFGFFYFLIWNILYHWRTSLKKKLDQITPLHSFFTFRYRYSFLITLLLYFPFLPTFRLYYLSTFLPSLLTYLFTYTFPFFLRSSIGFFLSFLPCSFLLSYLPSFLPSFLPIFLFLVSLAAGLHKFKIKFGYSLVFKYSSVRRKD